MGQILTTRTDGLGHARNAAALHSAQAAFEAAPAYVGDDDTPDFDALTDEVIAVIGRACRANPRDPKACADLLRNAAEMLVSLADEVSL